MGSKVAPGLRFTTRLRDFASGWALVELCDPEEVG